MYKKILLISLFLFSTSTLATSNGAKPGHVAAPAEGFVKTGLLMANGIVNPDTFIAFDDSYHTDARGRTPEQIEEHRLLAISYFEDTYEIDVAALVSQGKLLFSPFILSNDAEYRIYSLSDTWVPSSGFFMADGGWLILVTDPEGIELNDGQLIPAGSISVYGEYHALSEDQSGKLKGSITVHYQSERFIVSGFYGESAILCDVYHPDWGWGKAQGVSLLFPDGDDGDMNANIRNVWTFPGDDFIRPSHDVWFE